jgi:hypothetical protein
MVAPSCWCHQAPEAAARLAAAAVGQLCGDAPRRTTHNTREKSLVTSRALTARGAALDNSMILLICPPHAKLSRARKGGKAVEGGDQASAALPRPPK